MRNWKTTLIGVGSGALYYALTSFQNGTPIPQNGAQWRALVIAAALAGLGAVGKDFNVTGKSK
jgi:hypothetical protein